MLAQVTSNRRKQFAEVLLSELANAPAGRPHAVVQACRTNQFAWAISCSAGSDSGKKSQAAFS